PVVAGPRRGLPGPGDGHEVVRWVLPRRVRVDDRLVGPGGPAGHRTTAVVPRRGGARRHTGVPHPGPGGAAHLPGHLGRVVRRRRRLHAELGGGAPGRGAGPAGPGQPPVAVVLPPGGHDLPRRAAERARLVLQPLVVDRPGPAHAVLRAVADRGSGRLHRG